MNDYYIIIYAIMPSEIYKTKYLASEEKLIAERITALCKKEGYAWISNKALADMYGVNIEQNGY
jgi:aromatic ring-opening dioxygenase catalytic subunit (LigB family)